MSVAPDDERKIFESVLALPDHAQRAEYLDQICQNDVQLRRRIESLISAAEDGGCFMRKRPADSLEARSDVSDSEQVGQIIGRYKLLQKIGEGGFGDVYMAEQQEPVVRRVALKIIKPGMDSREVIARFDAERQALAMMNHPNIGKFLDAASTDGGRPYFVMELVRGAPVTEYCDAHRLSTEERLKLLVKICLAVQHAHQKGIIHRDIKPSNVLVYTEGDRPVPKVIDFGVAKATQGRLTDKTLFTQFRQFIGTPAYMSPEQAQMSGGDIDTRSDIYSLGVLLYELLTGRTPLDADDLVNAGYDEVCRRIREEDAPTPSKRISSLQPEELKTLANSYGVDAAHLPVKIRGDVDWIVMKAIEKDRARRYPTADAMAEDIQRHLNHEPVSAAPPSSLYSLRRFARKHRRLLTTSGSITLALVLGTVISTWQAIRATNATLRARTETQRAVAAEKDARNKTQEVIESEARTKRILYASEMAAAKRAFDQLDTQRTVELLNNYLLEPGQTDLRGFEWRWMWNQCNREVFQLRANPNGVRFDAGRETHRDMRFSGDGKWLATGSTDGIVRLWDFETRQEVWQYHGGHHCNAVDFSPDSRLLLAHFYRPISAGTLIWNIANPTAPMEIGQSDDGVRFLPYGETIVSHDGTQYDLAGSVVSGPYIDPLPGAQLWARTYSKDGKTLASKDRIWDVTSRTLLKRLPPHVGYADTGPNGVAISPINSNLIATGCAEGLRIWNRRGNLIRELPGTSGTPLAWLSFSKDGDMLAVRQAVGAFQVFETKTWTEFDTIRTQPGNAVLFSPCDNNLVVTGSNDGGIRAYRVSRTNTPDITLQHPADLLAMKFSPDGRLLAAGMANGAVRFWDVRARIECFTTPPERKRFSTRPYETGFGPDYVAFSPDSQFAAVIGPEQTVSVWDLAEKRTVASFTSDDEMDEYYAVCFSADGSRLFGAVRYGRRPDHGVVHVWERPGGVNRLQLVSEHAGRVRCLDVSTDGGLLAGTRLYRQGPLIWKLPEMQLLSGIEDIGRWDMQIAFSPDGSQFAIGGNNAMVWEVDRGQPVAVLRHAMRVEHVSWSPDGRRLSASDIIGTTKIWNVESKQVVATFRGTISAFSPDGTILAAGGKGSKYTGDEDLAGRVTLHYAPTLEEIDRRRASWSW